MRLALAYLLALVLAACAGCDSNSPCRTICDPPICDEIIIFDDVGNITLSTDPLTITEARMSQNILYLTVRYGGGCREHEFELYGNSGFLESYPVQASIYLSHDSNGDLCEALITSELAFDLLPLKRAYQRAYSDFGPVLLRVHEPGMPDPFGPLILYEL